MEKVKLPREVAEALEEAKRCIGRGGIGDLEAIAWLIPRWDEWDETVKGFRSVLHQYGMNQGNFFRLVDALRYGYEVEPEPITMTVTGEKISQLKAAIQERYQSPKLNASNQLWIRGALDALNILDLKIPGVNA